MEGPDRLGKAFDVFDGWTIVRPRRSSARRSDSPDFFEDKRAWGDGNRALGGHEFALEPFWTEDGDGSAASR
jgi:hypothetical protein